MEGPPQRPLDEGCAEKARRRAASGEGYADEPVVVQTEAVTLYVNFPPDRESTVPTPRSAATAR
jgi:hypothetical protein